MTENTNAAADRSAAASDWELKHLAHERLQTELQPANKTALFDALAASGVTVVLITFDGCGDSGQIEDIEVKAGDSVVAMPSGEIEIASAEWGQAEPSRSMTSIPDAIEAFAYDLLRETHEGWENNDGAYGDFTFDVTERIITLEYNERYMQSDHSQHVF